ncbi:HU family DNA-binding protein [Thermosulfurimonas marina]|uniref:HU family DNA-binding protein n=1 Tax=Thermosulfurimonas marina TaxID=2047767 RepID=UPI00144ADE60|nr:HU family DNA-binding protein [Thermosulfurimonas marina]
MSKDTLKGFESLAEALSERLGVSRRKARLFLRALAEELQRALEEEGVVHLGSWGRFRVFRGKKGVRVVFRPGKPLREAFQQVR